MAPQRPRPRGEATRVAEDLIRKVESLVVTEAPRIAEPVQTAMAEVRVEMDRLRQLYLDLERLHEQDEQRLSALERRAPRKGS